MQNLKKSFENCNKKGSSDSVKITLIIVIALVIIAVVAMVVFVKPHTNKETTINVNGVSQIKAVPDIVSVYISVETNGSTTKEANDKNSEIVDAVITKLITNGIDRKNISTENFNIYPQYDWSEGGQNLIGYQATHSLKVQISASDTGKIGDVVDASADAGAFINSINFELSVAKQNEYKSEALKQATEDARTKAESMAEGLGKKLGKLVSISDSGFNYYPWPIYARGGDIGMVESNSEAKLSATNIQPGQQDINAQVTAVFEIV
jgi:hypothetical protein